MKKKLLLLFLSILSINCYSQISFEKGYYINNSGQKTDCLIKNNDWDSNPTSFEYKEIESSKVKMTNIKFVKEFGVYHVSKYIRSKVNIDRSSNSIDDLSYKKNPILKEELLFLKVLIEGKANLYSYKDGNLKRYFYKKENTVINQLIFKKYKTQEYKIKKNNRYRQQLWNDLKCPDFKISKIEGIDYKKNQLVRFFIEYNEFNNQEFNNFEEKQKRDLFNLNIRPGLNSSSLSIENKFSNSRSADFSNELDFRFGIETEFILPFNKNKWAILIEPTYQYFKSEKELTSRRVKVNYKSIELPLGLRLYFFLSENSKIFINGSFIFDINSSSTIEYDPGQDLKIKRRNNLAFGLGYKHNDRYSLELRGQFNREILSDYLSWNSNYSTLSVIFGYSLF